jgi:hypothetical protein
MKALLCAVLVAAPLAGALADSLPPVDSLTAASNFAAFVRADVPLDTHRQAMRRLWALNPSLAGPDLMDMDAPRGLAMPTASAAVEMPPTSVRQTSVLAAAETLVRTSDYTAYLGKDVPLAIHQAAMRRLWATHPEFAVYANDPMHSANYADADSTKPQTRADAGTLIVVAAD